MNRTLFRKVKVSDKILCTRYDMACKEIRETWGITLGNLKILLDDVGSLP